MIGLGDWEYQPILPWNHLSKTFPWGVFMLQGAGLAIADGFTVRKRKLRGISYRINLGIRSLQYNGNISTLYYWCSKTDRHSLCYHHKCILHRINKQSCLCEYSVSYPQQYCKNISFLKTSSSILYL